MSACISRFVYFSLLTPFRYFCVSLLLLYVFPGVVYSQVFNVRGNISTNEIPVRYASVTFIEQSDTSKKFSAVTDTLGNYHLSVVTAVEKSNIDLPSSIELAQNYPNPFSSSTAISYKLNKQSNVTIKIYDIIGRELKAFRTSFQAIGTHGVLWDGKDNYGNRVASGIYFYQLHAENETLVKKMVFNEGSTEMPLPFLNRISFEKSELKRVEKTQTGGTFTAEITNTESTKPKILLSKFPNIVVQQDTTLNFHVQEGITAYSLCYLRVDSILQPTGEYYLNWEVYVNDIIGMRPKDISYHKLTDNEGAAWSPDGKYIAFINWHTNLYLYDILNDTLRGVVVSDTEAAAGVIWTPDGKRIVCPYQSSSHPSGIYIMDLDGSNKVELKYPVTYFYPDGYNTLYLIENSSGASVYQSNLDGTFNEFVVDLSTFLSTANSGLHVWDFDPYNNNLLISFDDPSTALPNMIAKYNITEKRLDTVVVSDSGWKCYHPKFSSDFKKIAMIEVHITDDASLGVTNRISLLESGVKTTLLEFREKGVGIDPSPFAFSSDDRYFAFAKDVPQPGLVFWVISYLYVIELYTKQVTYIDMGNTPIWNPSLPH